jgi:hypothetical protein
VQAERDWEFFTHGIYNTRYTYGMDRGAGARDDPRVDAALIASAPAGRLPAGYLAPALSHSAKPPSTCSPKLGGLYTCDLFHDDQPTPVKVRSGQAFRLGAVFARAQRHHRLRGQQDRAAPLRPDDQGQPSTACTPRARTPAP